MAVVEYFSFPTIHRAQLTKKYERKFDVSNKLLFQSCDLFSWNLFWISKHVFFFYILNFRAIRIRTKTGFVDFVSKEGLSIMTSICDLSYPKIRYRIKWK